MNQLPLHAILTVSLLIKFNGLRKLTATLRITLTRWHKIGSLDIPEDLPASSAILSLTADQRKPF